MRHPSPVPPLRPPQRLMPAPNDGGVFFGGRDYARRQQPQPNYQPQKPLLPQGTPPQQWQNTPNFRPGPVPLLRPNGPWHPHPHPNTYHSQSPPPPPPLLHPHQQFNPNSQTPITYVPPPHNTTYELMRIANSADQIPFLEPLEDEDKLVRQHLLSNNSNNDESLLLNTSSPSKTNKRRRQQQQQQQQQIENNRNMISYQDLDRPEEQRDSSFDNRLVPKSNKTNHLPSDKTNNQILLKSSIDNDHALKLELDRIKKAGAQEREKLRAQRQAAAEKEKEAQMKRNSAKTGDKEKREDGELGDSSDDENTKSTPPIEQKRLKKIVDNLALNPSKSTISYRSKTPPSESIIDMSVMKLIRPMKFFHLDDEKSSAYREYLTTNFGRVRVHCHKPQPNFFSNISCIEEIKRRLRLNNNISSSNLFRHLIDDNDQDLFLTLQVTAETEDGEIESDEENKIDLNGKKSKHALSDDDTEKHIRKKTKLIDDGMNDLTKSSLNEKPWITNELRQLIKQRNKLQAQILNGDTNADIEKKFKKMRNKICKHAKTLKAKYENSILGNSEPSLAPPLSSQQSTTDMNFNDVTVSWQDISDTERTALLNKPCPPRSKPKIHPPRKTPDRITSRVFSICQSAVMNNHTAQRPVRLNNLKNYTTLTSSKENVDNAYRTMIEFTETCKRESTNDTTTIEMPMPKRIRSSSPPSNIEQCASPSAISRYISHDSYLSFIPPSNQCLTVNNSDNIDTDLIDDALWDDWDLPSTANRKTPGKIRTMSSPAVHSRTKQLIDTTTIINVLESTNVIQSPSESDCLQPISSKIIWDDDDDDDDFVQLLSQFPAELPSEQVSNSNDSMSISTPDNIDDDNVTRLDATRRASAMLTKENQSLIHNTTKIELSSQPTHSQTRSSTTSLQRSSTGPLSPIVTKNKVTVNSPRVRCDSSNEIKKKTCTEAEIEQKRLAALAIRRQREQERQKKKS
ncbi:unnamed protein product [Adineta steineri]|uniref:Uncharacterized protein n=2 Tax=Adineta steineri TaxID=433720 RepID=A0A813V677_9BILA|nr:unnamed protein product [Adineta steineri]